MDREEAKVIPADPLTIQPRGELPPGVSADEWVGIRIDGEIPDLG